MLILLPLLGVFAANPSPADMPFKLWAIDPMVKVFRDSDPGGTETIQINCAGNEYQSGQFAIKARKRLENVTVELGQLVHESGYALDRKNFRWNFVGYVPLTKNTYNTEDKDLLRKAPDDFPDPLLKDRSIIIEAGQTQPVWLTAFIPKDAPAGVYRGKVKVKASEGEESLDISMNVYPFALPDERHLLVTLWFTPNSFAKAHNVPMWSDEYWEILGKYAKNMSEHRQNVVETPFPNIVALKKDGSLEIDYTIMDRWITFFEKHNACERIEFPAIAHAVKEEGRSHWDARELAINELSVKDEETGETVKLTPEKGMALMLADLNKHLQEKGWQDKAMVHVSDEPTIYKVESYCKIADFIHKNAPNLKIIEAIETTGFGKCLDIWVPKLSHFMNWYDEFEEQRKSGTEMWFYTCCHPYGPFPNRFIDFALIRTRILFWLNWNYRLDGYLHWGLNRWTDDPYKDVGDNLPPGDRYIIYPGKDGPVDSIRWEASREGLQDYEYFWLLTDKIRRIKALLGKGADFIDERRRGDEICRSIVRSITDFEADPLKLRQAREILAQEIIEVDKHPLILAQTTPQAETEVVVGPILIIVRGVVEKGATVKIQGEVAKVKEDGTFAGHAFAYPNKQEIVIEAAIGENVKQVQRRFVVK